MKFRKLMTSLCPKEIPFATVGNLISTTNLTSQYSSFSVRSNDLLDSYFEKNKCSKTLEKRTQ